jgi:hypothetical protein
MKIYIAHSNKFDFENKLYLPLRSSTLNTEHAFFLPHEDGKAENTKELMKDFDLLIAEVSEPSTGEGIEIGRADMLNIPIVCIYEQGSKVSNSLRYVSNEFIEYADPKDMLGKLTDFLNRL